MALVKRSDGAFLIRQSPLQFGTIRQARAYFSLQLQNAIDLAAQLRAAGVEAYAASDSGNEQDPAYVPPQRAVDLTVKWPSTWRVEVEDLGTNRYCTRFIDQYNVQHSVIAATPQAVVDKLEGSIDAAVRMYIRSITPEPEVQAPPSAPPVPTAPRKFLRPGSREITETEFAEMEAERQKAMAPKTPPIEVEYLRFYNNSPANATKLRMKTDPGYLTWLEREGILNPRSTTDASRNA
jgi:hypothetical protein